MDGPKILEHKDGRLEGDGADIAMYYYEPDGVAHKTDRKLTKEPTHDSAGRRYYEEAGTGEPLMVTDFFKVPFTPGNILRACGALQEHTTIAEQTAVQGPGAQA